MEDEDRRNQLKTAAEMVRAERRKYNVLLKDVVEGRAEEYNTEDLLRLVSSLEATYNHLLAALAADGDIYCVLKHLGYCIILAGELDNPDVEALYDIMTIVTNGRIEPCAACKDDASAIMEESKRKENDD